MPLTRVNCFGFSKTVIVLSGVLFGVILGSGIYGGIVIFDSFTSQAAGGGDWKTAKSVYEFNYTDIDGQEQSMERYK